MLSNLVPLVAPIEKVAILNDQGRAGVVNKQVLIGWIAGPFDGDNDGRFVAYSFSREVRTLGPQQVETKIDQDSFLSEQFTLWDQQGSEVRILS